MSANSEENDAKMQGSEDEQEEEAVIELKPYSHQTLLVVKSCQNQNGLRHNDYARYH